MRFLDCLQNSTRYTNFMVHTMQLVVTLSRRCNRVGILMEMISQNIFSAFLRNFLLNIASRRRGLVLVLPGGARTICTTTIAEVTICNCESGSKRCRGEDGIF